MKSSMRIEHPDGVYVTLTVTMTLDRWRRLREQLSQDYPSWEFASALVRLIGKVERAYSEECDL